jgi:hypothetical protein
MSPPPHYPTAPSKAKAKKTPKDDAEDVFVEKPPKPDPDSNKWRELRDKEDERRTRLLTQQKEARLARDREEEVA